MVDVMTVHFKGNVVLFSAHLSNAEKGDVFVMFVVAVLILEVTVPLKTVLIVFGIGAR